MSDLVNKRGNIDDIRNSLRFGGYSREDLEAALMDEQSRLKRSTVIRMLENEIKKLDQKEGNHE